MNPRKQQWQRLVKAAQQAPPETPRPFTVAWTTDVVKAVLPGAALGQPGFRTLLLARLCEWKVISLLVLALVVGGVLVKRTWFNEERLQAARYEQWADETLRQLRAWHPLSCEQSGEIGLLVQQTVEDMRRQPARGTNVAAIVLGTQQRIAGLLTPEERTAFAAEQARLTKKYFPPP